MTKVVWVVEKCEYGYFSGVRLYKTQFSNKQEAVDYFAKSKASDFCFGHLHMSSKTTLYRAFVGEDGELHAVETDHFSLWVNDSRE